jgi:hypothetical protein
MTLRRCWKQAAMVTLPGGPGATVGNVQGEVASRAGGEDMDACAAAAQARWR